MSALRRYPGILAWLATAALVVACDVTLARSHKPTMSRTLGAALRHPVLGPVLAGGWLGLTWHLICGEPFEWAVES